jgi:hypothetical protein
MGPAKRVMGPVLHKVGMEPIPLGAALVRPERQLIRRGLASARPEVERVQLQAASVYLV